jgi:hypothetical protein
MSVDWSRYPNFKREEFTCRCGCGRNEMRPEFLERLQALRSVYGKPMAVTSGYRCPQHPKEAAKAQPGMHTTGLAADIGISGARGRHAAAPGAGCGVPRRRGASEGQRQVPARRSAGDAYDLELLRRGKLRQSHFCDHAQQFHAVQHGIADASRVAEGGGKLWVLLQRCLRQRLAQIIRSICYAVKLSAVRRVRQGCGEGVQQALGGLGGGYLHGGLQKYR